MDLDWVQRQWLKHAYDGFPREISIFPDFKRKSCRNAENYTGILLENGTFTSYNCYTKVYPDTHLLEDGSVVVNKIAIDLDKDKLGKADIAVTYDEMRSFVRYFRQRYGYTPRTNFSGSKGFHVWIDLKPVLITRFKPTFHAYIDPIMKALRIVTLDTDITFDRNRIMRIPYTMNTKTKRLCRPIKPEWSLTDILSGNVENLEVEIGCCPQIDQELKELDKKEEQILQGAVGTIISLDPKIRAEKRYIRYIDEVSKLSRLRLRYAEGRHRTLWCVLVPRLAFIYSDGHFQRLQGAEFEAVKAKVERFALNWAKDTPECDPDGSPRKTLSAYQDYIQAILRQIHENGYSPWSVQKFLLKNPELAKYWLE